MQTPLAIVLLLPGFLLLVRYASLKQFHFAFSSVASLLHCSIPPFIKVSCQIFTLITYAYCMSCCWMQVVSQRLKKSERSPHPLYPSSVICHMPLLFPSYLYRCLTASHETVWQPEETFCCDVKTHPSSPSHRYERACIYQVCCLNFYRLSCFLSYLVVTGCISNAHAICDMSSQSSDEENKVWGILYSDRWKMQYPHSKTICSAVFFFWYWF